MYCRGIEIKVWGTVIMTNDLNYKVSIIMPVYNSQKYIRECIDSMVGQTLKGIQIICVDDGSTDESLSILHKYCERNPNLQIVHTEHIGASNARNEGFKYAQGEYVIFLDSDDVFEKDMLEEMYNSAITHDADVVICEWDQNIPNGNSDSLMRPKPLYFENIMKKYIKPYSGQTFTTEELPPEGLLYWSSVPWNKLCRKEFLIDNAISFQNIKRANDNYFVYMMMIHALRIVHINSCKAMVHYRTTNSIGQISNCRTVRDIYAALEKIWQTLYEFYFCTGEIDNITYRQYYVFAFTKMITEFWHMRGDENDNKEFYDCFAEYGLKNIGLEQGRNDEKLGLYRALTDDFKNFSYDTKWFLEKTPIGIHFEQRGVEEFEILCKMYRVAIWGAGMKGTSILGILKKYNMHIEGVIDSSPKKQGSRICGYEVVAYEKICDRVDVVVITGREFCDSICGSVYQYGGGKIKILPLFLYTDSQLKLEDCIFTIEELRRYE